MGNSRFWVRSIPTLNAEERASNLTVKTVMKDYPGAMGRLSVYYLVLRPGTIPHEIHAHDEEEIFVLLSGHLDIISPANRLRVEPGSFFHHPPGDLHTIESVGSEAAAFLAFRWTWEKSNQTQPQANFFWFDANKLATWDDRTGIQRQQVCDRQPLANGGELVVHYCHVLPKSPCRPHQDPHDVILVLLSGQFYGMGHTNSAPAVIYYPAGITHAIFPNHSDPIEMLEFDFHRPHASDL